MSRLPDFGVDGHEQSVPMKRRFQFDDMPDEVRLAPKFSSVLLQVHNSACFDRLHFGRTAV